MGLALNFGSPQGWLFYFSIIGLKYPGADTRPFFLPCLTEEQIIGMLQSYGRLWFCGHLKVFRSVKKKQKKKQRFEKLPRERKQPPRGFSHTLNIKPLIYWSESICGCLLSLVKFRFVAACTRQGSRRHSRCPLWAYWLWSSPPWGGCWGQWFLPGGLSFPLHGGETVI